MENWKEALNIFEKYAEGYNRSYPFQAEHEIIYSFLDMETCPENSEDGKRLQELGWHCSEEGSCWAIFV